MGQPFQELNPGLMLLWAYVIRFTAPALPFAVADVIATAIVLTACEDFGEGSFFVRQLARMRPNSIPQDPSN